MNPTKVCYEITDKDLPMLKALYDLDDSRSVYFPDDYHREIEKSRYSASCTSTEYKPKKYWLQEVENKLDFMKVTHFEKVTWYRDARVEIECKALLTSEQKTLMFKTMTDVATEMLKTTTITFDVGSLKSFQFALSLGEQGIKVFQEWLYGHVFAQTEGRLNTSMDIKSTQEGVYQIDFLLGTDVAKTQQFVYARLEKDMVSWLKQDVLDILETD